MNAVPIITKDTLLEICGRIGNNKAPDLQGIPNQAIKLAVKFRSDMLAYVFEVCLFQDNKSPGKHTDSIDIQMLERVIYNRLLSVVNNRSE